MVSVGTKGSLRVFQEKVKQDEGFAPSWGVYVGTTGTSTKSSVCL